MSKFNAGKASVLVLTAVLAFVLFLFSGQSVMAAVNSVTPSTNDINRTNEWAHVDQLSVGVGTIDLSLIQPRDFTVCFEYRTDGNTAQQTSPTNYNTDITDGLYPYKCLTTVSNFTKTLTANEYVEVRMVFGGETDERFDWTRFDVEQAPTPETCVGDQHLDATGLKCVSFSQAGPPVRNDEATSGQVLGASTSPKGQVLGASTMAKTGSFAELSNMIIMTLGGTLSAFGIKNLKKTSKKA